jgi:hypothetical protein
MVAKAATSRWVPPGERVDETARNSANPLVRPVFEQRGQRSAPYGAQNFWATN